MSRLYDNQPLSALPVHNLNWSGEFKSEDFQSGNGVILEGIIKGRSKHVIVSSTQKYRYFVFHVEVKQAHKRKYDDSGKEIEPNFSETQKIRTGFLHSSYKTEAKGQTDKLTKDELSSHVVKENLLKVTERYNKLNCIPFWMEEKLLDKIELLEEDIIRLKTRGNSMFIDTIAKKDAQNSTVSNYAGGEQVGVSWTDKVMTVKQQDESDRKLPQDNNEGVDDDEWDD